MSDKRARFRKQNAARKSHFRATRSLRLEALERRRCLSATAAPVLDLSQLEVDVTSYESSLIVRFRSGVEPAHEGSDMYGPSRAARTVPLGFGLHEVELKQGVALDAMLASYRGNADVVYAEPDYRVRIATLPDDPRFTEQWGLHNTGQSGGTIDADIDAPEAWDLSTGTGSTIVAVIDTGVDYRHPDLAPNMWTNSGEIAGDGIDNDNNGYIDDVHGYDFFNDDGDPLDDHNHGTHVAGTIGAEGNDGIGVSGVNWDVQIMAVKFLGADGSGSTSDAIAAVQYAVDNGAHISNNSWGGDPYSQAMFDVIEDAGDADHIFVAAAGNGNFFGLGINNDVTPFYPASYDLDNVVAVAATDRNDQTAIFSNYGRTSVDIGAPGVDILSTLIDGGYGNSSGTSMATPHVSGALSLVRDFDPSLSPQQIIDRVLYSADPINALQDITVTGARLNLASALVPDTVGPRIVDAQPGRLILDPYSSIRITFDESIDASTFTAEDIASFTGPAGEVVVTSIDAVEGANNRQFDLIFATQSVAGTFDLVIAPEIRDRFGNQMDQNEDGVGGETSVDEFVHQIVLADALARLDFGTVDSPVAPGYARVTSGDHYDSSVGYGWQSGSVYALNRGGEPLTQDVNYTVEATFAMDLPNGEYDVIVTLGEQIIPHDQMGVFLEGVQVDSVSTEGGEFAVNTYRTTVSDGQLSLGLRDLGGSNSWVTINGLDVVFAGPDLTGPRVVSTDGTGTVTGPIDRIVVSFNEGMQAESFSVADVAILEGPDGSIVPTGVHPIGGGDFEVTFDSQSTPGDYRLVLGPDIVDVGGNPMDQDGDGVGGEAIEDQFETQFTLEAGPVYVGRFDFGTTGSAVAEDYTQVASSDSYDVASGFGWYSGVVYSLERGGDPLTRDVNYTTDAIFVADVANGEYDIVVTMGELLIGHDQMGVFLEGVQVDSVTTAGGQFAVHTYRTSISDGQLTLGLRDLGGSNAWTVINGLDVIFAGPDLTGPNVLSTDASGTVTGPIDKITLSFNEAIEPGSFTIDDVSVLVGPDGAILPTGVQQVGPGDFEVTFQSQATAGVYRLVIGPDIVDVGGNPMDQNGDGVGGETVVDQFETIFTLEAGPLFLGRFDFGTTLSPVAVDYTPIASNDSYDPEAGYGWQSGPVYSLNRGGDPLTRDINYTVDATFGVDVPNGEYDVIVTMGEHLLSHDQMGVFVEGVQVDSVTTAGGQFAVNTYRASISDGQLNLGLRDLGGSNAWAVINGLEVVYAGPDLTGPHVLSTDAVGTVTGPIDRLSLTFNEAIEEGSFTIDDVIVLEGPGGAIVPTGVHQIGPAEFELTFASQDTAGLFRLVIGPEIHDVGGNLMNQDSDQTGGETVEDQFVAEFTLELGPQYVGRFDFGQMFSPVAADYTEVRHNSSYNATSGFGWQGGPVYSLSRGGDPLTRDVNYTKDATYAVDVANGEYDVVVTMGEHLIGHDQMGVYLEEGQVDSITTAGGQFAVNTYRVTINDGQLSLGLRDLGGSNAWVVINGLDVIRVGGPSSASAAQAMATDLALAEMASQ